MTARVPAPTAGSAITLLALLAGGCAGQANDYAKLANAYADESASNAGDRLAEVNDGQLRWYARLYCDAVSAGAVDRRYVVLGDRETRDIACEMERRNGW